MKINDIEFEFNATKLSNLQRFDEALPLCADQVLKGVDMMKAGQLYTGGKLQIDAIKQFFLSVTDVDVVGDCDDIAEASAMLEQFQEQIVKQTEAKKKRYFKRT